MMTSERQRAANRANAKLSTGPRSPSGKARASRNARRHGLAAQVALDADRLARAEQLARAIMEATFGRIDLLQARSIAQAELAVRRGRAVANALLAQLCATACGSDPASGPVASGRGDACAGLVHDLKMVERYLRRAQARRDRLLRRRLSDASR